MHRLMLTSLIALLLMTYLIASCSSSEAKQNSFSQLIEELATKDSEYLHKRPAKQTWTKCTLEHVGISAPFDYRMHFCYAYCEKKVRSTGKCVQWGLKKYHVVNDHQLMVDRGVWIVK